MTLKKTVGICLGITAVAAILLALIYNTEPKAERSSAVRQTAMLVDVIAAEQGTFRPTLSAVGSVRPEKEILLSPRVSGEIVSMSSEFTPGGFVERGDLLLQIDPADYETALLERRSQLRQTQADLELEEGRQQLARQDYEELQGTISNEYKTLVLREPQLDSARAQVEAEEAAVRRAELELDRTRIRAPFAAQVLSREVNEGSQVSPGQTLGRLVGTSRYWIEIAVPGADVRWIQFPNASGQVGSTVRVRNRAAWPKDVFRSGQVYSLIGALEDRTRLARVLMTIEDPLAHEAESAGLPPLMVGSFVEVQIDGLPIENVVRLPRQYLRKNDTVWVKQDGVLKVREVNVVYRESEYAYIDAGLEGGDQVVTTNLSTVVDGAELRLAQGGEQP